MVLLKSFTIVVNNPQIELGLCITLIRGPFHQVECLKKVRMRFELGRAKSERSPFLIEVIGLSLLHASCCGVA